MAEVARYLEIDPPAVNRAIRESSVPAAWLYKVAYQTGCRIEWLRTGEEPKYLKDAIGEALATYRLLQRPHLKPLFDHLADLDSDFARIIESSLRLMKAGEGAIAADVLDALARKHEYDQKARGDPRKRKRDAAS